MAVNYTPNDPVPGQPRTTSLKESDRWIDYADTIGDVDTRLDDLETFEASVPGTYVGLLSHFSLVTISQPPSVSAAVVVEKNAVYPFGSGIRTDVGSVNNFMAWELPLLPGTWTFEFAAAKVNDSGIVTLDIDGVDHGTTFDLYDASAVSFFTSLTGVTVPASGGSTTVKLEVLSKNASSSAYRQRYSAISGRRTGA